MRKILFHSYLLQARSQRSQKNSTLLTPNTSQFSKQGLEKFSLKNNVYSRGHVLEMRRLGLENWAQE